MCAYWSNEDEKRSELSIEAFDIDECSKALVSCGSLSVKRIYSTYSQMYYDKRPIPSEKRVGILVGLNGLEKVGGKQRNKPATDDNIIGYMVAHSSGFDNPDLDSSLLVGARYDGNGFSFIKIITLKKCLYLLPVDISPITTNGRNVPEL